MKKKLSERGSALLLVAIIVIVLVGISFAYMSISWWSTKRVMQDEAAAHALYIAESGAAAYINSLNADTKVLPKAQVATSLADGTYWVATENLVDFGNKTLVGANNTDPDYCSFQVSGKFNKIVRRVNVFMTHKTGGVFWNAIYAGNSSAFTGTPPVYKDNGYSLDLGGPSSTSSDTVKGDIYTGGDFNANPYANLLDENGNKTGSTITYNDANNSGSLATSPTVKQGLEPSLDIARKYGPSGNLLEAEANALYNYTGGTRDANGTAWVDVGGQFTANGKLNKWVDGSTATDILDPNNPAHIFRKDPSSTSSSTVNRTQSYEYVAPSPKTDFYLEDPTNTSYNNAATGLGGNTVNGDTNSSKLNVNNSGNNAVYFIDGNMRVSGEPIKSYQLEGNSTNTDPNLKLTFVVKGNVSLTDNLLYPKWQSTSDAVAIIAVTDPNYPNSTPADFTSSTTVMSTAFQKSGLGKTAADFVTDYNKRAARARSNGLNMPDLDLSVTADQIRASQAFNKVYGSGNVYFGDPGSGTVEHFEAFMFAENNFYATNLDTTTSSGGTTKMEIFGNMTAGNQVNINRSSTKTSTGYVPLSVTFDPAVKNGGGPPGLPQTPSLAGQDWHILSWKQSAVTAEPNAANEK